MNNTQWHEKIIVKVPNQRVIRWSKYLSSSSSDRLVQNCVTFMMAFAQNGSVFHWAVHHPITFSHVGSLMRHF